MNTIHLIRSDNVYRSLLDSPPDQRDDLFKKELLAPFKQKFYQQGIPFQADKEFGFDALMLLSFANITSRNIDQDHLVLIDQLDEDFWQDCQEAIELGLSRFEDQGIATKQKEYIFTALIGEESHPAMYLNNYYSGDGGIPGYIFLSLVPNEYTLARARAAILHEVNHNMRYQYIDWDGGSLPALIVSEGLAENFVDQVYGPDMLGPWVTGIDWQLEGGEIKEKIQQNLNISSLNKASAYLYGDPLTQSQGGQPVGLPHGAGYACGYYLVKHYLERTGMPVEKASIMPASEIMAQVEDFWEG